MTDERTPIVTDSAAILSPERSTPDRPRDPVRSSASSVPSPRTVTRLKPHMIAADTDVYLASEVDPLLAALETERDTRRQLFDAFMEGQEASIGGQPRESNPYPPGDAFGQDPRGAQWEDGYDCNINRVLKAALAEAEQEITRLTIGKANSESCTDTVWDDLQKCMSQRDKALNQVDALTARAEAAEAENARLRSELAS